MNYLYADIFVSGLRVKSTLGVSINDGQFNPKTQQVIGKAGSETNILINTLKLRIMEMIRNLQKTGQLTKINIKNGVQDIRNGTSSSQSERTKKILFTDYIKAHIERSSSSRKGGTIRQCKVSFGKLIKYEKYFSIKLSFEDINMDFYYAFVDFCTYTLNLSVNTIGTHIKNVKMWMNEALLDELHQNQIYQRRAFKKLSEDADTIYLSEQELAKIINTTMPFQSLENVRDLFILACYTGVRMQDYNKLNRFHMINEETMLRIRTEKTGVEVVIPLHSEAKRILTKYNGMPRIISNQKFNDYLKDVCRIAGIDELVNQTRTTGGKKITTLKHKYELVSSHCARRSFATNAYKAGLPTLAIMAITGHKTEKIFLKYVRVSKEEHAGLMSEHPFFQSRIV